MYISKFQINNFGAFSEAIAENLSYGLNIFFGSNGSGKTSCVKFLSELLSDCRKRTLNTNNVIKNASGNIELIIPSSVARPDIIEIIKKGSQEILINSQSLSGKEVFENALNALSGREYAKVFGFGLSEIEKFADEKEDAATRLIFGASFGDGLLSPSQAMNKLDSALGTIYGNEDTPGSLAAFLSNLSKTRQQLDNLETIYASRNQMAVELFEIQKKLDNIRTEKREISIKIQNLQKRLLTWRQWKEWDNFKHELQELGEAPEDFPVDAIKRLELIIVARNACEQQIASRKVRIEKLQSQIEAIETNKKLEELTPRLRRLAERKSAFENAINQQDSQSQKRRQLQEDLNNNLNLLGAGWDCEKITALDRSLFARERQEQLAEELTAARQAHQAALATLTSSNQEVSAAEQALSSATIALASLPDPSSEISSQEREELRSGMGRLQECRRQNKSREKNLENARFSLARALEQAHISPAMESGKINLAETRIIIQTLLNSRNEALNISSELQKLIGERDLNLERVKILETNADKLQKKINDASSSTHGLYGTEINSIDTRSRALHTLRNNVTRLENSRERLKAVEDQLAALGKPVKSPKRLLVWPGLVCLIAGLGLFVAYYIYGLTELNFSDFQVPVNLPLAYASCAAGFLLFSLGLSTNKMSRRKHREERARLLAFRENGELEIENLNLENNNLAKEAGVGDTDMITLDAAEVLLEREKEQTINDSRTRQEVDESKKEHENLISQINELQENLSIQESKIQQCRKKWADLLDRVKIAGSPSPESAPTVFTRVEACQIALDNVSNAENELNALWEDMHLLESGISAMPAVSSRLTSAPEPIGLEEAVHLVLESCKNADKIWQDKVRAQSALQTVENDLARAHTRQKEAASRLEESTTRLESAREAWRTHTTNFGFGEQSDPQTMREALRLMDKCLETRTALDDLIKEIEQNEKEISEMQSGLSQLLKDLGEESSDSTNPLASLGLLESLQDRAETNLANISEQKNLASLLSSNMEDQEAALAELAIVDNREKNLLDQANAKSQEEFLKLSEKFDKKQLINEKIKKLETSLSGVSGDLSLPEFLAAFKNSDEQNDQSQLDELQARLDNITDEEQKLAANYGICQATMSGLDQPEDIALARQKKAVLKAAVTNKFLEWGRYAVAKSLLERASTRYEKISQPRIMELASKIFRNITGDEWKGLQIDLERKNIYLIKENGDHFPLNQLNRSFLELVYIALRMAFIRDFADLHGALPLIMDEVLANFDPANAQRLINELADLSRNQGRDRQQILYFTCQPFIVDQFRKADKAVKVFNLDGGKILTA